MLIALALAVAATAAEEVVLPEGEALAPAVAARDAEFFTLLFEGRDPDGLQDMLAADFAMYHDRGGVVATAAEPFVREYREACVARRGGRRPGAPAARSSPPASMFIPYPAVARSRMASVS